MQDGSDRQPMCRDHVRRISRELDCLPPDAAFGNLEGGSVEQQRDRRLLLHDCANYALAPVEAADRRFAASSSFDLEGYLSTLHFVQAQTEAHDRNSFSLVAELRKT